ncbi:MAG: hypothetical protein PSV26_02400 [Polaromonas sp.]|uniref:hypothetical protein n=1 Tax=Polaromonas sp. TaxID=1869339 RepID=UPI002487FAB9|nr:hypothetical protein [Polaromonas sp.]MDI1236316.1 hypothetical protein [Polaromonas sp.]
MLLLLLLGALPCAHALEFSYGNPFPDGPLAGVARSLRISGELVPGDTARLTELMRRKPADAWHALGRVELAISGGDTTEALLLADTLATLYPHTVATTDCAGACALVWLAGAWRLLPAGRIGLQQAPASAPDKTPTDLRNYLLKQGLPASVYQRWMASRSQGVFWLSGQEVNTTGTWPPYYYQKLSARCPPLDSTDESFHAVRRCAARLVISQKAFAFDKLLEGVNDPWWNDNRDLLRDAPR